MSFSLSERAILLRVKGVGPTVVARLEQMGITTLADLATRDVATIVQQGSELTGASCWKNSPHARAAIEGAVRCAIAHTPADPTASS